MRKGRLPIKGAPDGYIEPELRIVPGGSLTYLWMGDKARCWGYTIVRSDRLRRFAVALLETLDQEVKR